MSTPVKVLVTGFGPFLDITKNPSWEIARHLPSSVTGPNGEIVTIIVPAEPIPAAYHKILAQVPVLIQEHAPDLVVHMGLDVGSGPGVFKLERSALRDGYHDIPDIERRVFTRADNKKLFGKASSSLTTTLDIDAAAGILQEACYSLSLSTPAAAPENVKVKGKGKSRKAIEVRLSDDVGSYVCGFNYYISLLEMQKRTSKRDNVFFHVPQLESKEDIQTGEGDGGTSPSAGGSTEAIESATFLFPSFPLCRCHSNGFCATDAWQAGISTWSCTGQSVP